VSLLYSVRWVMCVELSPWCQVATLVLISDDTCNFLMTHVQSDSKNSSPREAGHLRWGENVKIFYYRKISCALLLT